MEPSSISGILSAWKPIQWVLNHLSRPKLRIQPFDEQRDLRTWALLGPQPRNQKVLNLQVVNEGKQVAKRCVATLTFTQLPSGVSLSESTFALHWADTDYTLNTSSAAPVDIGAEGRRLDVVFTHDLQDFPGCWVATPFALAAPFQHQAHLPPGYYSASITVAYDNGPRAKIHFRIKAPIKWDDLSAGIDDLAAR